MCTGPHHRQDPAGGPRRPLEAHASVCVVYCSITIILLKDRTSPLPSEGPRGRERQERVAPPRCAGCQHVVEAGGVAEEAVPRPDPLAKGERQAFSHSQDRSGQTDSMCMASSEDRGHTGEKWVESEYYVNKPCLRPVRERDRREREGFALPGVRTTSCC